MAGLSVGFWSPVNELGDVEVVATRIKEICGPSSVAFPFVVSPVREGPRSVLSYAVIRGHVPIHIDRPNAAEACSALFTFVVAAENRPVLLYAAAGQVESQCILVPDAAPVSKMGMGAIELVPGRVLHFDIARAWHGITGFPTGDYVPELPEAVLIQIPWADPRDIAGAVGEMRRILRRDERFDDLRQ